MFASLNEVEILTLFVTLFSSKRKRGKRGQARLQSPLQSPLIHSLIHFNSISRFRLVGKGAPVCWPSVLADRIVGPVTSTIAATGSASAETRSRRSAGPRDIRLLHDSDMLHSATDLENSRPQ